jgi:NDP-sugar pyrophosphorylase family protein
MSLPVAILAGGLATRLGSVTAQTPKALLTVAGRPFAEHQLALLRRHGLTEVVFCVGHLGEQIEAVLGDGRRLGLHLRYAYDGARLLGTGGALRRALPLLGEVFFVLYGDSYLDCDYRAVEPAFRAVPDALGLMTVFRNAGQWDRSNLTFAEGRIWRYDKAVQTPDMHHIDYGLGVLRAQAFAPYPLNEPLDLAMIYQDLLRRERLAAYEVARRFYEIGSSQGLEETRRYLTQVASAEPGDRPGT